MVVLLLNTERSVAICSKDRFFDERSEVVVQNSGGLLETVHGLDKLTHVAMILTHEDAYGKYIIPVPQSITRPRGLKDLLFRPRYMTARSLRVTAQHCLYLDVHTFK